MWIGSQVGFGDGLPSSATTPTHNGDVIAADSTTDTTAGGVVGTTADSSSPSSPTTPAISGTNSTTSPATAAASDTSSTASPTVSTGSSADSTKSAVQLHGGVKQFVLNLEKLRDVGLDLKHILKASGSLYDEVTIQPVQLIYEPEIIGGTCISLPIGSQPIGPVQPARKDRVDLSMSGMRPLIDMMKKNVDEFMSGKEELALPDSVKTELKPQFKDWVYNVDDMAYKEQQLEKLTSAQPYDQQAIADAATYIHKDVRELDKARRSIYKVIRREGKRIAAAGSQD
jgi:hypothetical protein